MKKITGKVVSLVLALALVVTSFSGTFAFAAAKTESASVTLTHDTAYLSNGGSAAQLQADVAGYFGLATAELYDHYSSGLVSALALKEVVMTSGSGIASLSTHLDSSNNVDHATLTLNNLNVTGKITLAGRYQGTVTRPGATDSTTVYATATLTVNVLDNGLSVIGTTAAPAAGAYPTALGNFEKNVLGTAQTLTGTVYAVSPSTGSALAKWNTQTANNTATAAGEYKVSVLPTDCVTASTTTGTFTLTLGKVGTEPFARVGNVAVQAVKYVGTPTASASTGRLDIANTVVQIQNKIKAEATDAIIYVWHGGTYIGAAAKADTITTNTDKNVTGADIDISAVSGGVTMQAGSVATISGASSFIMQDGAVQAVADTVTSFTMTKGTAGKVQAATVIINGGKTGDITSATSITVDAADAKVPTTTGALSAPTISVNSTNASTAVGAIKAPAAATISLLGSKTTVGAIDCDYRATTLNLNGFSGSISAPVKADSLTVNVSNNAAVSVTGAASIPTLSLSTGKISFTDSVKLGTATGSGVVEFKAGKLYATGSLSGISLKLADAFKVGDTIFSADAYKVYEGSFTGVGFTAEKVAGTTIDTFKVKTVDFANIVLNKSSSKLAVGQKETFTVSNYPVGTKLPDGYTIKFSFDGNSDNFDFTSTATTATVSVKKYESVFSSLNKGNVTATVMDPYGFAAYGYAVATCAVEAVAKPAYTSDTTKDFSLATGASYTFLITSDKVPTLAMGTPGVFTVATPVLKAGTTNQYLVKITATGKVGASTGIYVNGDARLLVVTVKAPVFKCDTVVPVTVAAGKSYTYKVTAGAAPSFVFGTANVFAPSAIKHVGNDYFFTITPAANAKSGAATGVYVNGVKVNVATVK